MIKDKIKKIKPFLFPLKENNYRPTILDGRFLVHLTFVLVMLKFISLFFFTVLPRTPYFADVTRGALLQMANQERLSVGLKPLNESPELIRAAELKAQDMLKKDYFSHWSPDGVSPWHWFDVAGYDYKYAGENLAIGFLNAKDVHRSWVASPSHRNNILGLDYNDIGIAVVEGDFHGQKTFLVVQVFGSRNIPQLTVVPATPILDAPTPVASEKPITEIEPIAIEEPTMGTDPLVDNEAFEKDLNDLGAPSVLGVGPTISPGKNIEREGVKYSIFNFIILEYDDLLSQIILYIMIFIGFVMVVNVFVKLNVQHPDLIFKGLGFLLLFFVFNQFDQMTLVRMITDGPWIG